MRRLVLVALLVLFLPQAAHYCLAAWTQDVLQRHSALVTAQFTIGP